MAALVGLLPARGALAANYDGGYPDSFIEYGADARTLGMGRAFAAAASGPSSLIWNPAGLGRPFQSAAGVTDAVLFEGGNLGELSGAYAFGAPFGIGASLIRFGSGSLTSRDSLNNPIGSFQDVRTAVILGAGFGITNDLSVGVAPKLIQRSLDSQSSSGFDADVGVQVRLGSVGLGVQYQNVMGAALSRDGGEDQLPRTLRGGISLQAFSWILATADYVARPGSYDVRAGVELRPVDWAALRAGYDGVGPTFGVGFRFGDLRFDYAGANNSVLGFNHKGSIGWAFGPDAAAIGQAREKWWETSRENRERRREEAAREEAAREAERAAEQRALALRQKQAQEALAKRKAAEEARARALAAAKVQIVAVADLRPVGLSSDDAETISEMLRSAIVNSGSFRVLDRENMERILEEQQIEMSGVTECATGDCASKIGKMLNVDKIIVGSVSRLDGSYVLTAHLVNVTTSEIVASKSMHARSVEALKSEMDNQAGQLIRSVLHQ